MHIDEQKILALAYIFEQEAKDIKDILSVDIVEYVKDLCLHDLPEESDAIVSIQNFKKKFAVTKDLEDLIPLYMNTNDHSMEEAMCIRAMQLELPLFIEIASNHQLKNCLEKLRILKFDDRVLHIVKILLEEFSYCCISYENTSK